MCGHACSDSAGTAIGAIFLGPALTDALYVLDNQAEGTIPPSGHRSRQ